MGKRQQGADSRPGRPSVVACCSSLFALRSSLRECSRKFLFLRSCQVCCFQLVAFFVESPSGFYARRTSIARSPVSEMLVWRGSFVALPREPRELRTRRNRRLRLLWRLLRSIEKPPLRRLFSFFYSISSEYQVQTDLLPNFGRDFGVEVFMYQRSLLSFGRGGLDRISTGAGKSA